LRTVLGIFSAITLIFLAGAGERGKKFYHSISQSQPEGWFVYNCRYHIGEYFITSLDYVAYFLEYNQPDTAAYFEEKAVKFLQKEAPARVQEFRQVCEALRVRHSLGWKRVFPAGFDEDPVLWLEWYYRGQENAPPLHWTPSFFSEMRNSKGNENIRQ